MELADNKSLDIFLSHRFDLLFDLFLLQLLLDPFIFRVILLELLNLIMFPLTLFGIFILVEHGARSMPLVIEEYANIVGVFDIRSINDPAIAILHLTIQLALEDIP